MSAPYALLVDDSPTSRDIFGTILERGGFRIRAVRSGEAALAAVAEGTPDIVVLDLFLPDIDGIEVLRRLRSSSETEAVPVVCITAGPTDQLRERVEGSGFNAIVSKTDGPQVALDVIQDLLDRETDR